MLLPLVVASILAASITGRVTDPQGRTVLNAEIRAGKAAARTAGDGTYSLDVAPGTYEIRATADGFAPVIRKFQVASDATLNFQFTALSNQVDSVTVTADAGNSGLLSPDPATRVMVRQETLDANPGRPGFPVSIPGMPVESPAGGIKPPQYFVPGVAGDHGEPIAQFFQIGGYLFPNNLPANAHGNGYADPNILIPIAIEAVETDGGSFNVREGNNSVNAATIFGLRDRLEPMLRITADYRDMDAVAAWSPPDPSIKAWIGLEFSFGNGFLDRLEHRKQYKVNASRVWTFGPHDFTVYGIGYHGFSFLPGLIPIDVKVPGDTYDNRQREEASSGIAIVNDVWHISPKSEAQFSGFWRNYFLDVRPNFGDGWIRQTENRTATSETALFIHHFARSFSMMTGVDHRIDSPHGLYLYHFNESSRQFDPTTGNNLDISFVSPYAAVDGALGRYFRYDLGLRYDEIFFQNRDLLGPERSFSAHQGVGSPKATIGFQPPGSATPLIAWLPALSLSYGQAFHVNDPRIGTTDNPVQDIAGRSVISKSRSYQLVARKTVSGTDFRLTLIHTTVAQQLARINNDTGLPTDVGPAIIRSFVVSARRNFAFGALQGSFAKADARDRITGEPTPEAPRLIWDTLATFDRLPFRLQARVEFSYVGRKPLGDGFDAVQVRELRGALIRTFENKGIDLGMNFFLASGYGGQTLETLALPMEDHPFERITGFPLRSYITASITYRFRR